MKKILAIALTLTLVFALAVSSSAATLASAWVEQLSTDVHGQGKSEGIVEVNDDNTITFKTTETGTIWFQQAGVAYKDKVAVDGLKITFNPGEFIDPNTNAAPAAGAYNSFVSIFLSNGAIADFACPSNIVGARTPGLATMDTNAANISFAGGEFGAFIDALGGSYSMLDKKIEKNADATVEFKVEGDLVYIYINNVKLTSIDEETNEPVDFTLDATKLLDADGKAYLGLSLVGEGGMYNAGATFKTINGQAANSFNGQAAGGNTPAGPADIEVVAIAGAMIVALMAAAFVVKARKA